SISVTFSFTHTPTTQSYTLSLHDALPISENHHRRKDSNRPHELRRSRRLDGARAALSARASLRRLELVQPVAVGADGLRAKCSSDRKSTRLNSSHVEISYAVFCLKKKKKT